MMKALQIILILTASICSIQSSSYEEDGEDAIIDGTLFSVTGDIHNPNQNISDDDDSESSHASEPIAWPDRIIPFEISSVFSDNNKRLIFAMMERIQNVSCVRFLRSTSETTYVDMQHRSDIPCKATIGFRNDGARPMSLQDDCMDENGVLHELMHVLGLRHEHNRFDRENHIKIIRENIQPRYLNNFKKRPYLDPIYFNTTYDFNSVTHYKPFNAFAIKRNLPTIETLFGNKIVQNGLSDLDIKKINLYYQCDKASPYIAKHLFQNELYFNTPLHIAARSGEMELVINLLGNNSNAYAKNQDGDTPIHLAAQFGQTAIISKLLDYYPNLINVRNNWKASPLHIAAMYGRVDTVSVLLDKGAHVNAKSNLKDQSDGIEPLITPLHLAAETGDAETVRILLEKKADVHAKDYSGDTPIHLAASVGKTATVNVLLQFNSNLTNARNKFKSTPLHMSVTSGDSDTVLTLLDKGAGINDKMNDADSQHDYYTLITPLHIAVSRDLRDIVHILLRRGADVYANDKDGNSVIHLAALAGHTAIVDALLEFNGDLVNATNTMHSTALHLAVLNGETETVLILLEKGSNINAKSRNRIGVLDSHVESRPTFTPLHIAVFKGHSEIVHILLNNHADVHAQQTFGDMPIHIAASHKATSIVDMLLEFNVSLVHARNYWQNTPLHNAANSGITETVLKLLEKGADVNAKAIDFDGEIEMEPLQTALHLAVEQGHSETVRVLLEKHADIYAIDGDGFMPIHLAAHEGKTTIVKILLNFNASQINLKTITEETPLHFAFVSDFTIDTALALLERGALVNARNVENYTPLDVAIRLNCPNSVVSLLRRYGAQSSKTNTTNFNVNAAMLIHRASLEGNISMVNEMLKVNPILVNVTTEENETPLHLAASRGHVEIVLALLEKGADVNAKANHVHDMNDVEPLITPLHFAAEFGDNDTVWVLLMNHADVHAKDKDGNTPIHFAAREGKTAVLNILLNLNGTLAEEKNMDSETPLHLAASRGHVEIVLALLEKGADVNTKANHIRDMNDVEPLVTPSHFAFEFGDNDTVWVLSMNHADVRAKDKHGNTPIHFAAREGKTAVLNILLNLNGSLANEKNIHNETPLHLAAKNGKAESVIALLDKGADINAKAIYYYQSDETKQLVTALHLASKEGHAETVRILLSRHADVYATDTRGNTPIHLAALVGETEIINILLNFNYSQINLLTNLGDTPLHLAAYRNHQQTALSLLVAGADVNIINLDNLTALDVAELGDHWNRQSLVSTIIHYRSKSLNRLKRANKENRNTSTQSTSSAVTII